MSSVAISIFPEFIDKIETLGLSSIFEITQSEIINTLTGSKIIFKGIKAGSGQQTANLKSIANVDTLVVDESEEIPDEATFDKIDLSIRSNRHFNKIIILFNPTTKASWIYERFFQSAGVEPGNNTVKGNTTYIHTTYLDIRNMLPQNFLETIERMKKDNPKKYKHVMLGAFLDVAEGVVFSNWRLGEFPEDSDYDLGADFGWSNDPNTLVKVLLDDKRKQIHVKECLYQTGLQTGDLARIFKEHAGNRLIVADSQEGRLIEEIRRHGLNIKPCTKGAGSVIEGIVLLQDYEIIVDPSSTNLIKELNNYVWAERGSKPVSMYDHLIDPIRYLVTHRTKHKKVQRYSISGIRRK